MDQIRVCCKLECWWERCIYTIIIAFNRNPRLPGGEEYRNGKQQWTSSLFLLHHQQIYRHLPLDETISESLWKDNSNVTDCFTVEGNEQSQVTRHKHSILQKAHENLRSGRKTTPVFIVCQIYVVSSWTRGLNYNEQNCLRGLPGDLENSVCG